MSDVCELFGRQLHTEDQQKKAPASLEELNKLTGSLDSETGPDAEVELIFLQRMIE